MNLKLEKKIKKTWFFINIVIREKKGFAILFAIFLKNDFGISTLSYLLAYEIQHVQ